MPAPCQSCRSHGIQCIFKPSLNGRGLLYRGAREESIVDRRLLAMLVQVRSHGSPEQVGGAVDILRMRRECGDMLDDFKCITTSLQETQPCLLPASARGLIESDASLSDPPVASARFSSRKP